jgi:hypothetical protein
MTDQADSPDTPDLRFMDLAEARARGMVVTAQQSSIVRHRKDLGLTTEEIAWLDQFALAVMGEFNTLPLTAPPRIAKILKGL